jgi:hypothetical protein
MHDRQMAVHARGPPSVACMAVSEGEDVAPRNAMSCPLLSSHLARGLLASVLAQFGVEVLGTLSNQERSCIPKQSETVARIPDSTFAVRFFFERFCSTFEDYTVCAELNLSQASKYVFDRDDVHSFHCGCCHTDKGSDFFEQASADWKARSFPSEQEVCQQGPSG